jgi:hypothetical protein
MSRVRITARDRQGADQTPYPGNVNQPDRSDPAWDEYHTFEQKVNHELPDMRHQWQDDSRDDIGFGVPEPWGKSPTVAGIRIAANKAVRVAVLLLGDKVSDEVIEAQAKDLMFMGHQAMDRTLQRFADTQKLYAEEEEKKDEAKEEVKAADEKPAEEVKKVDEEKKAVSEAECKPAIAIPGSEEQPKKAADEKKEEPKEDLKAMVTAAVREALSAAMPEFIQKKMDEKKDEKPAEKKDDDKKAADEKPADEKKEEVKAADESEKKDEAPAEDKKASAEPKRAMGEFDIELSASMDDEPAADPEADERLASLFDGDGLAAAHAATAGDSTRKVEASQKKTGITKLGGQPRVASTSGAGVDISSIWATAPDVSDVFGSR